MTKARDLANASTALSAVSATELGYLDGVTSAIQTQFSNISGSKADPTEPTSPTDGMIWIDTDGAVTDAQYIAKTLTTTTGDIIYASGANTPARLGIGSTSQILTVSGGVPAWATPAATTPTAVGVSLTGATQTVTNGTPLTVAWNQEFFDTDGFHDNATNNSRITIPAGKAGKYLISCAITWQDANANTRIIQLWKNGVSTGTRFAYSMASIGNTYYYTMFAHSAQTLAVGDYLQVEVSNNDSSAKYIYGTGSPGLGEGSLYFSALYLGA